MKGDNRDDKSEPIPVADLDKPFLKVLKRQGARYLASVGGEVTS
jgi:hypothetical protein